MLQSRILVIILKEIFLSEDLKEIFLSEEFDKNSAVKEILTTVSDGKKFLQTLHLRKY
jgi:hypothetical protein